MSRSGTKPTKNTKITKSFVVFVIFVAFVAERGPSAVSVEASKSMALTFDDLPKSQNAGDLTGSRATTRAMLEALRKHRAPAVAFVNAQKLYDGDRLVPARVSLLQAWIDAGIPLGNHTFGHVDVNAVPLEDYEKDVTRGETGWLDLMRARGWTEKWFRHPYTHTGKTPAAKAALDRFLRAQGYRVAPFTIENSDWLFSSLYATAKRNGDAAAASRIRDAYLTYTDRMVDWFETLALEDFGRAIPQILLIHANDLHEDALDALLARIEARGYGFVPLDEAMRDPAYAAPDDYVGPVGPSWLHRWRVAKHLPPRLQDEPDPPQWILDASRASR